MTKSKFPLKLHPSGSLVRRVVLICLCLLVLPLFLHSLFIYRQEYQQRLAEAEQTLQMIGEGEQAFLEEKIQLYWRILDAVSDADSSDVREYARQLQIIQIPLPTGASGHFAIPSIRNEALLTGKQIPQQKALAIKITYQEILEQFSHFENAPYSVSLALALENGEPFVGHVLSDALTVKLPIPDTEFHLVLSSSSTLIREMYEREMLFRYLSLLVFIVLIGGLLVWIVTRRVAKPLRNLCTAMQRVQQGAIHIRYVPDRMGFEINELGKQFNETLDALLLQSQEAERERIAREKLREELRIGHEIQASLFPTHIPEIKELDIGAGYLPAREVGGDFYDLFLLENGSLFLAIADTAGKGISACLYSLGLRSSLRSFAALSTDLSEIVLRANDLFWIDAKNTGMFVTLWAAIYDPKKRLLTYCNQGHVPAFLMRDGRLQELTTAGIALGAQKLTALTTESITLHLHDLLFLYTDGVIEAHDPDQQLFGSKRLREFLSKAKKNAPGPIIDQLLEEIHLFAQGTAQHDDITALALRICN